MGSVARWVWFPFDVTIRFMLRNGKRIAITIVGIVLVLGGLVLMVLPGPGIVLLIAGLAVLATEYVWAQRMLNFARHKASQARDRVLRRSGGAAAPTPPAEPPEVGPED